MIYTNIGEFGHHFSLLKVIGDQQGAPIRILTKYCYDLIKIKKIQKLILNLIKPFQIPAVLRSKQLTAGFEQFLIIKDIAKI